jgi:hypothetical protein
MMARIKAAWLVLTGRVGHIFTPPDGAKIVDVTQWRDVMLIVTDYGGVYMMAHRGASTSHMDPDIQIQKLRP